jgi:YidC/Oxa1 family membrane protein insertase
MEKRVIIAVALSIAVLLGFNYLFPTPAPVKNKEAQAPASKAVPATQATSAPSTVPAAPVTPPAPVTASEPERTIVVDTDLYTGVISTHGGVIKSWKLKKYKDTSGKPIEMVTVSDGMAPLVVAPEGMDWRTAQNLPYKADHESVELAGSEGQESLSLTCVTPDGRSITKTLTFKNSGYDVGIDVKTSGIKTYTLYMGEDFGSVSSKEKKAFGHVGPLTMLDGEMQKDEPEDIEADKSYSGAKGWTGVTDKFFMAVVIPAGGIKAVVGKGPSGMGYTGVIVAQPEEKLLVYAGPKEYDRLKALDQGLSQAVDFGWFTFIAKPLFVSLKYFYSVVKNWGWAIIILTVIVKLLFAPLTHKSQKSMKRMQKLQPLFAELKEKYKGDPQRMNQEMMALYKTHKVNPMGGCLPMLVQIPVFVALYNVLNLSVELRQAPFGLWLTDLSAKDPYYILPVLMGLSMLAMQKMTPSSLDSMQNKIMMFMPVMLTFMFISLPSGLVLYFTVSNLLSMAQQFYINKYSKDE